VPIDELVAAQGIPVRTASLPLFFTGALVYVDGLPVIILNAAKPEFERRGALAHMLGHVLVVLNGLSSTYPRETSEHREADIVAEELMMPTPMVLDQSRLWFNDHRYLARLFGVSEERMLGKMRAMGLVRGPDGVLWEY
jgi:Zn-dependent peptidase ImmA (M78 family)